MPLNTACQSGLDALIDPHVHAARGGVDSEVVDFCVAVHVREVDFCTGSVFGEFYLSGVGRGDGGEGDGGVEVA